MPDTPPASPLSIVALISARGGGDWPSVVALAVGLHNRGHSVCLVCDVGTEGAVRATGLPIICVPPALEQPDIRQAIARSPDIGPETPNPLTEWAQVCAPGIRAQIEARKPMVLLSSLLCMGLADQLASDLGVPWCFINPSFYFGEDSARPSDADFLGVSIRTYRYWFQPLMRRATVVLHATDAAFDMRPIGLPRHHHYIGPLIWEPSMVAPEFLRSPGPPWVLVSVSTLPQAGEVAIVQAAVRALRHEGVRVLVTVAPEHAAELGQVPDHVYLSGYVPHSAVLAGGRLIISHAGHGIVMKALYHGVPMVLVPWGRDQPGVAARAEALGVAAVVQRDACSDTSVAQAVRQVLDDPRFTERVRAISKRLQADDAVTVGCTQVELFVSTAAR
jgi:Erythromycin biosynthesis protein CIII-like, C-terminal domain